MPENVTSIFSILPEQASSIAGQIDLLYLFLVVVSVIFSFLAAFLVIFFAIRYRRRPGQKPPTPPHADNRLELIGSGFLLVLLMIMFVWGAKVFFQNYRFPSDSIEILVIGKQWMWKVQHPQGKREINELHLPLGQPIKLTMTSEDVIHSFYIPAFRVKQDVVPGRYTAMGFTPTKLGKYHLFCTEYCGTEHSKMGGWVYVLTPQDYQEWLQTGQKGAVAQGSPVEMGAQLFTSLGCATCHHSGSGQLGPNLTGVYGHTVVFEDGTETVADENYLRESILNSQARIVKGYQPVMPLFKGLVNAEQLSHLIAYIKSLSPNPQPEGTP